MTTAHEPPLLSTVAPDLEEAHPASAVTATKSIADANGRDASMDLRRGITRIRSTPERQSQD
jgi:hypothetical protein